MQMRFLELFREEMGATYGVSVRAGFDQKYTQAELSLSFQCDPTRAEELREAALKEVRRLMKEGISKDHFAKAKAALTKRDETAMRENGHWIATLSALRLDKLPMTEIFDTQKHLDTMKWEDLKIAQASFAAMGSAAVAVLLPGPSN